MKTRVFFTLFLVSEILNFASAQSFDSLFNGNGIKVLYQVDNAFSSTNHYTPRDIKATNDGKLLILLTFEPQYDNYFSASYTGDPLYIDSTIVILLNADGTINSQFNNGNGAIGLNFAGKCLHIYNDGKFLIGGTKLLDESALTFKAGIYAFNANGSPDPRFSGNSNYTQINNFNNNTSLKQIKVRSDEKIWVYGDFSNNSSYTDYFAIRLNANGTLDTGYDGNGLAVFNSQGQSVGDQDDFVHGVMQIDDDNFVLYGVNFNRSIMNFGLDQVPVYGKIAHFIDNGSQGSAISEGFSLTALPLSSYYYNLLGTVDATLGINNNEFYIANKRQFLSGGQYNTIPVLVKCENDVNTGQREYTEESFNNLSTQTNKLHFTNINKLVDGSLVITGYQDSLTSNNLSFLGQNTFLLKRLANGDEDPSNPLPVKIPFNFEKVDIIDAEILPDGKMVITGVAWDNYITGITKRYVFVSKLNIGCVANSILPASLSSCEGESITLNPGLFASYQWSTGATSQTIEVNSSGMYSVSVVDANGCTGGSMVNITFSPYPETLCNKSKRK
jgi:hypothetical protein